MKTPLQISFAIDLDLERRVHLYLAQRGIEGLDSIHLSVAHGHVLLEGVVPSSAAKWRCCECCRHVAGVFNVVDRLAVVHGAGTPERARHPVKKPR